MKGVILADIANKDNHKFKVNEKGNQNPELRTHHKQQINFNYEQL